MDDRVTGEGGRVTDAHDRVTDEGQRVTDAHDRVTDAEKRVTDADDRVTGEGRRLEGHAGAGHWEPRPFRPPLWARGPHAQTLMARVLRPARGPTVTRERLETPDGDFVDVDWGPEPDPEAPLALVLHGLEGSSSRRYVRSVMAELLHRGVRPVAMNFRGCSGEANRSLTFYHSGDTRDPSWLLDIMARRYPGRRRGIVGFSLGGNVLLKMLGERDDGGRGLVDAAAAMSVPYDLAAGCDLLEESFMGRVYSAYFLRSLRRKLEWKREPLAASVDLSAARRASTIREFDERVTAPLNDFRDADDYYRRSSSRRFLGGIRVPTLLLHAVDDPFLPPSAIPREEAGANPAVHLHLEPVGGHVGFLEGRLREPRFWGEETCAAFLAHRLLPGGSRVGRTEG